LQNIQVEIFNYTSEFTLLCYTDGLTDTSNFSGETITSAQIQEIIKNNIKSKPDFINQALLFFVEEFKGETEFPDDIALLTIKIQDLGF
jgi:serine phosphatase RsbU (regulator of sigma subunit)